jgi:flavodoxin I
MKSIAIIYGSTTDNTKDVADLIALKLIDYAPKLVDVAKVTPEDFLSADFIFIGASTWSIGELQDDWDTYLPKIKNLDLKGKLMTFFGAGDSYSYSDTFADALGILYEEFEKTGVEFVGSVSTEGYSFDYSRGVIDGKFVGLPFDPDNEDELTEERVDNWLKTLIPLLD